MKNVYKFAAAIFLVIVVAGLTPIISFSHSGRTDGNGGHYDNFTGEYHYHHGYPAHQHTNGVCPYNYKENNTTNTTSTNNSSQGIPWYVYVIIVAVAVTGFLLDLKFDGKVSKFSVYAAFCILFSPFFIISWIFRFVGWIIKKFK